MTTVGTILAVIVLLYLANYNFQLGDDLISSKVIGLICWALILLVVFGWIMWLTL